MFKIGQRVKQLFKNRSKNRSEKFDSGIILKKDDNMFLVGVTSGKPIDSSGDKDEYKDTKFRNRCLWVLENELVIDKISIKDKLKQIRKLCKR